jgi:hypothetical protein
MLYSITSPTFGAAFTILTQNVIFLLGLTRVAEICGGFTLIAVEPFNKLGCLPFLIYLDIVDNSKVNKRTLWTIMVLLLAYMSGSS